MCETPGGLATREEELQLSEAFALLQRPATEDEAYALAYFACRSLARGRRPTPPPATGSPPVASESDISGGGGDVRFVLQARGGLRVECGGCELVITVCIGRVNVISRSVFHHTAIITGAFTVARALRRVGVEIYRHLDWGVRDDEERELSPALERLIEGMTCGASGYGHPSHAGDDAGVHGSLHSSGGGGGGAKVCVSRVRSPDHPERHYSSVLHSLYLHASDKRRVASGTQNLKRMEASDTFAIACRDQVASGSKIHG
ncbi:unnamed protein product [Lampetra planeri]